MESEQGSPRKQKCIVPFARSWNALAVTRCLGRHGIEVITGDISGVAAAAFSRYSKEHFTYPNCDKDPDGFINKLVAIAEKHQAPDTDLVLMPIHTCTFTILCHRNRFDGLVKMALPTKDQFELLGNKTNLALFCQQNEIRTPPSLVVSQLDHFAEEAKKFTYPAFLKIPTSTAAIGMHKVSSADEAVKMFDTMVKKYDLDKPGYYPILQQRIDGEDYCSTFLFDHGELRATMTYHNILDFPRNSGMGAVRETVEAPEMEAIGSEILSKLKWHGVAQIDFRWDGTSKPWLIEVNPRFWGGIAQSIESGWEYPYLVYQLAVNGRVDAVNPERRKVRTWNPGLVLLLAFQELTETKYSHNEIAVAYHDFKNKFREDQMKALQHLLEKVSGVLSPHERLKGITKVLKDEEGAVNEFFCWEDPMPMLGLLYPLMILVRHGTLSPELLIGKAKIMESGEEEVHL